MPLEYFFALYSLARTRMARKACGVLRGQGFSVGYSVAADCWVGRALAPRLPYACCSVTRANDEQSVEEGETVSL